jgi:hypothetical protein
MRTLHIANGHHLTSLIEQSGIGGETSVWADPLHDGPVPAGLTDPELRAVRARFLAGEGAVESVLADLEAWSAALDGRAAFDELVLWFEHDLFDQLNLLQVLTRIGDPARTRTTLVSIDGWPGRTSFKGMGELPPQDIATLYTTRQPVPSAALDLAAAAWRAFRSPSPRDIEILLTGDTTTLPFLANALRRHFEEFPSTHGGLSRSERRLVERLDHAPEEIGTLWPRMWEGETAYYITDGTFWQLVQGLATASPALVTVVRAREDDRMPPAGQVALTLKGRAVLEGTADRVHLCGIDTWRGGVHVAGRGPVWRWNPDTMRMVMA